MILDGQNVFSALDVGDLPTAMTDTASTNVIDQEEVPRLQYPCGCLRCGMAVGSRSCGVHD